MNLKCPNCNGEGPFLILTATDKIDGRGIADRTFPMEPPIVFYMCVTNGPRDCGMAFVLDEVPT